MAKKYNNIPVKPEIYVKVAMLAESNGFGERGLGAQIESWVRRDLPECGHKKQAVNIEYAPAMDSLAKTTRAGWYCPTCKRVYASIGGEEPIKMKINKAVAS